MHTCKCKPQTRFNPNINYRIVATFVRNEKQEKVELKSSDGSNLTYQRLGFAEFEIEGKKCRLTVFQPLEGKKELFVPFKDTSNGEQTYIAGRYLIAERKHERILIDFNTAHNPYCAYNHDYACPLPPAENHLDFAVLAGEKVF